MEKQEYEKGFGGPEAEDEDIEIEDETLEAEGEPEDEETEPSEGDTGADDGTLERKPHEKPSAKVHDPLKTRLNRAQREKYQALDALQRLQEENERLRAMAEQSSQVASIASEAATRFQEDSITARLANARQLKAEAIEAGDTQAIIDADIALGMAINDLQRANNDKAQAQFNRQQQQQYQQQQRPQVPQPNPEAFAPVVEEWVQQNEWINPDSEHYDDWLANQADLYAAQFNQRLIQAGLGDQVASPDYFEIIDNHIAALRASPSNPVNRHSQRRELNMKAPRGAVSGVRGGNDASYAKQTYQISSAEKEIARRMGIDDKTYIKHRETIKADGHEQHKYRRRGE